MKNLLKLENDKENDSKKLVTIDEEKKLKKISTIVVIVIVAFGLLVCLDVLLVSKLDVGPFLAIRTKVHNDGGTKEYYGFGYKVIKYNQTDGRKGRILGSYSLKYNVNPHTASMEDLAFSFGNDANKSFQSFYKEYFRVTGRVSNINKDKKIVTLSYESEDDNYNLDLECTNISDDSKLSKVKEKSRITVSGSLYSYQAKKTNSPRTISLNYCNIK